MFRVVLQTTGGEFLVKSLGHDGADEGRGTGRAIVADAQQKSVIGQNVEIRIILGVVPGVKVQGHIFGACGDDDQRTEQTFPSSGIPSEPIIGIDVKGAVIAGIEGAARRPRNGIGAADVLG